MPRRFAAGAKLDEESFDDSMVNAVSSDCTTSNQITTCTFTDPDNIATNNRKRFYCIYSSFCADSSSTCTSSSTDPHLSRLICKTGLLYDGRPADVFPSYTTRDGVKFQFLDTSTVESGFRVYRDTFVQTSSSSLGQLIADIPFTSQSCGQQFAPLQYADRDVGDIPGKQVAYIIASVDSSGEVSETSSTRITYTQPWVSEVAIKVTTKVINQHLRPANISPPSPLMLFSNFRMLLVPQRTESCH